jgi:hypothetical protein
VKVLKKIVPAWVREMIYQAIAAEIEKLPLDQVKRAVRRALGLPELLV